MAIINCPECKKNVSSLAKQCVHCGCKINHCPECGSVWAGDSTVCPKCGYKTEVSDSKAQNKSTKDNESYNKYLELQSYPFSKFKKKSLSALIYQKIPMGERINANVFSFLSKIMLALMIPIVFMWPFLGIDLVSKTDIMLLLCFFCIFISFIFFVIGNTYGAYKETFIINKHFDTFIKNENINLKDLIAALIRDLDNKSGSDTVVQNRDVAFCLQTLQSKKNPSFKCYPSKIDSYSSIGGIMYEGITLVLGKMLNFILFAWAVAELIIPLYFEVALDLFGSKLHFDVYLTLQYFIDCSKWYDITHNLSDFTIWMVVAPIIYFIYLLVVGFALRLIFGKVKKRKAALLNSAKEIMPEHYNAYERNIYL